MLTPKTLALCTALVLGSAAAALAGQTSPAPELPSPNYRIEPSDVLEVKYRYTPEYDYTLGVQPDGYINLPIAGEVLVAGLTVSEATNAIKVAASRRLRDPELTIELKEFQKPRFFVMGEVNKPDELPLRGHISLLQAIAMAGGFKSSAKHSQVVLVRRLDEGHAFRRVLNAKELVKNPEPENDVVIQPGDLLYVPQNRISKVSSVMPIFAPLSGVALLLNVATR